VSILNTIGLSPTWIQRILVVFPCEEIRAIFCRLDQPYHLIASLLYVPASIGVSQIQILWSRDGWEFFAIGTAIETLSYPIFL